MFRIKLVGIQRVCITTPVFYYYGIGQKERKENKYWLRGKEVVESVTEGLRYKGQGL